MPTPLRFQSTPAGISQDRQRCLLAALADAGESGLTRIQMGRIFGGQVRAVERALKALQVSGAMITAAWAREPSAHNGFDHESRKCVEAELMDWADDVSYSVHDLDDFYRAGLIPLVALIRGSEGRKDELEDFLADTLTTERMDQHNVVIKHEEAVSFFTLVLRGCFGATETLDGEFDGRLSQKRAMTTLVSELVSRYVNGEDDGTGTWLPSVRVNTQSDPKLVTIADQARKEVFLLKQLMRYYVFENPALRIQQYGQEQMINTLFRLYYEQIQGRQGHKALPNPYREIVEEIQRRDHREITGEEKARVVADFISGLTEIQAMKLYSRATGNSLGSITDLIFM